MPKSKVRKKKVHQRDGSGKITNSRTKKHINEAKRAMMMRTLTIQNASNSLTAEELNIILESAIARRDSTDKIKGHKLVLQYIETKLDENNIPIDGETKELVLSNADIPRLNQIVQMKKQSEEQMKEQVNKTET